MADATTITLPSIDPAAVFATGSVIALCALWRATWEAYAVAVHVADDAVERGERGERDESQVDAAADAVRAIVDLIAETPAASNPDVAAKLELAVHIVEAGAFDFGVAADLIRSAVRDLREMSREDGLRWPELRAREAADA